MTNQQVRNTQLDRFLNMRIRQRSKYDKNQPILAGFLMQLSLNRAQLR
ncbi:MAG: hypothetical protein RJA81_673, partial [Planctomycetota bacterium]